LAMKKYFNLHVNMTVELAINQERLQQATGEKFLEVRNYMKELYLNQITQEEFIVRKMETIVHHATNSNVESNDYMNFLSQAINALTKKVEQQDINAQVRSVELIYIIYIL